MPVAHPEGTDKKFDPLLDEHQHPDPEYQAELMRCVTTSIHPPSDLRRRNESLAPTVLEGCVFRTPDEFFPPKRLLLDAGQTVRRDQILLWRQVVDLLLWEAQQEAFSDTQAASLAASSRVGVQNVRRGVSIGGHQENMYFDVETAAPKGATVNIQQEVQALVVEVKGRMDRAVKAVLSNRQKVDSAINTAEVYRTLIVNVVFEEIIQRIDSIRARVENPEDVRRLYAMLTSAVQALGRVGGDRIDPDLDLEVVPLASRDAVIYGCDGLYKPAGSSGGKAQVCIPMSKYGTAQTLSMDAILEILAHEVGHHLSGKKPLEGKPSGGSGSHDLQHAHWEKEVAARLSDMRWDWKTGRVLGEQKQPSQPQQGPAASSPQPPQGPEQSSRWSRWSRWLLKD